MHPGHHSGCRSRHWRRRQPWAVGGLSGVQNPRLHPISLPPVLSASLCSSSLWSACPLLHSCWYRVLENSPGDRELVLPHSQQCLVCSLAGATPLCSLRGQGRAGWELYLPGVLPRADSQRPLPRDADARVQGARCSKSKEDSWHPPSSSLPPSPIHSFLPPLPPSFSMHHMVTEC